jgi:hypothetical protein
MTAEVILGRLRRFLLLVAASLCFGTMVELWFMEHFKDPNQLIPFALCGLGVVGVGAVLLRPRRWTIAAMRATMLLMGAGSLLGIYLHLANNFEFELDIRPGATAGEVVMEALRGASPLLAPGMLALVAALAIAATWYHPGWSAGQQ